VPFFMAGGAGGALKGGLHLKTPNGTPLANVMLGASCARLDSRIWNASATARARSS
jgi:hypothetical protein